MSGVAAQAISHIVRRGVEQIPTTTEGTIDLGAAAGFDDVKFEIPLWVLILSGVVTIFTALIIASVDYTVGSVAATLANIESPSSTTIVESAPPAYTDEPDAPLEKKIDVEDVEVVVINHKPITASIIGTVKHLHRVGGFFARWRGLLQGIVYHATVNAFGHIFGGLLSSLFGHLIGTGLGFTLSIIVLCRLRMLWTHSMIAMPTNTPWYKRFVSHKQSRALLLPSLVYVLAQQATLVIPVMVAILLPISGQGMMDGHTVQWIFGIVWLVAIPTSCVLAILYIYLPAAATLTRIEACLLPEDQQTIVPFDRMAIMGDIDLTERRSSKKIFAAAWKSFTGATRLRLVKLYVKLMAFELAVLLIGLQIVGAIFYFTNQEQIHNAIDQIQQKL